MKLVPLKLYFLIVEDTYCPLTLFFPTLHISWNFLIVYGFRRMDPDSTSPIQSPERPK